MAHAQKENQKNTQRGATQRALSAADRTLALYKHTCVHCGGLTPCAPESLVAVLPTGEHVTAPGTGALNATEAHLESAPPILHGVLADESPDVIEYGESDEEAWREEISQEAKDAVGSG